MVQLARLFIQVAFKVKNRSFSALWPLLLLLSVVSCGRYFHTPLIPANHQSEGMAVNDDGSVTYRLDRLAIELKPMTDAELNRLSSAQPDLNPYTFGDWAPHGEGQAPPRFTIFRLKVSNYQFPKIKIEPQSARISTANTRQYPSLTYSELYTYFRAHWLGRTGLGRKAFQARTDALKQTMYTDALVFSGNEEQGYLVFPALDDDVAEIEVHIQNIALRFDYTDAPVESIDLSFAFQRDILQGRTRTTAVRRN